MVPIENNGSVVIYKRFIRPYFLKHQASKCSANLKDFYQTKKQFHTNCVEFVVVVVFGYKIQLTKTFKMNFLTKEFATFIPFFIFVSLIPE